MDQLFEIRDSATTIGTFLIVATFVGCTSRVEKHGAEGQRDTLKEVEIAKVATQPGAVGSADKQFSPSMGTKQTVDARAPDRFAQAITEFFWQRDQWLLDKTIGEMPASNTSTPIEDALNRLRVEVTKNNEALKSADADVTKNKEFIKPIESRIFRNTLKNDKKLKGIIDKDKARAQELKDAIAKAEARGKELEDAIAKARKHIE